MAQPSARNKPVVSRSQSRTLACVTRAVQASGVQNLWADRPERTKVEIRKRNNVHVINAIRPDAPVLVYAHGFGCSQHMWRHITPAFEGKCHQVLFDYVGCGQSDLAAFDPVKYASLKGYVQDLLDVCDALGIERGVHFVGHSVSASIGLLASIERPMLVVAAQTAPISAFVCGNRRAYFRCYLNRRAIIEMVHTPTTTASVPVTG